MLSFAIKMIIGDRAKFIGILLGLTFSSFIITQQSGIFAGLMQRTYGFLTDTSQPDIWVMESAVQHIDDIKPFRSSKLYQTRSIEGVAWAVPLFKGLLKAKTSSGIFQQCNVIGIDDATLIGGPPYMLQGCIENLRYPDAIIVNRVGAQQKLYRTGPKGEHIPVQMGEVLELNDRRAYIVGFCDTVRTFQSQPVVYTTYQRALEFAPAERNLLSFILVKAAPGVDPKKLAKNIHEITGLSAYTRKEFRNLTLKYYLTKTGIPINFGFAVLLGFVIGTAIAGQTFYTYAHDNMSFFATFKAMGATNRLLIKMILSQAMLTATLGWSFGIGLTVLFGLYSSGTELSFTFPWWLMLVSAIALYGITLCAALMSVIKIIRLDPSTVFQL
ncbi:MAG: ABC transporter permease [Verrucomicrobia bacterium]|nr:ABC transporter permease [Verrucomicrobiota bacterium]